MRVGRPALLTLLGLCAAACHAPDPPVLAHSRIPLSACDVPGNRGTALCGTLDVWENRDARSGRRVPLAFVLLPARGRTREAPDPVFYLAGGPGASAIDAAGQIARELEVVHRTRDLVFVDARGTGRSGALRCPSVPTDAPLQQYLHEFLAEGAVRACLEAQTADVRYYSEPYVVDDLEEVRAALGYQRVNLYGSSGGTRVALLYLREYETNVRTLVLHGVHPPDGKMPLAYSRGLETAVRSVVSRCASEAACAARHEGIHDAWERLDRKFAGGAVDVEVRDPRTGRRERVRLTRGVFAEGLRHLLYDLGSPEIPAVITRAADGDFDPFVRRHLERSRLVEMAIAGGMFLTATCAQDVRFITEEDVRRETGGTFLGDYRVRRQQSACAIWPAGAGVGDDFVAPVRSEVPALLLSGDADVATPAQQAERVARELPNARHVVFPRQGHALASPRCAAFLITQFIISGSASNLDPGCVS